MTTELLLPVGNMEMCLAAIHHGADAIYVGAPFFNARGRTTDLSFEELKEMIDLCHLYGVKVNLAFNVVIFQNEFPKVIEILEHILPMGPDAIIVQDLGLAKLIRSMCPQQRIHASTQMTVTNADAIRLVEDLGIDRFVLGRENSLPEIKLIREQTSKELEVFVHGALCVAYSGQCFTSESLGGRSANRGQCAQSCRLEYELYVDEVKKDMGDKKYLVSPKDLMGLEQVRALKNLGVNSFKVEGRLKTAEYVASASRNYREVLDGGPLNLASRVQELSTTYSRGFFSGWFDGVNHQKLVDGTFSAHRGLEIGSVREVRRKTLIIESKAELKAGMGLLFVGKSELGSKIFSVTKNEVELVNKNLDIKKGDTVYINSDEQKDRQWQKGWQSREHQKKIPIELIVDGSVGQKLVASFKDDKNNIVSATSEGTLTLAQTRGVELEEFSALGTTPFIIKSTHSKLVGNVFLNHKELKSMRRELVEKLTLARLARTVEVKKIDLTRHRHQEASELKLHVLVRTFEQAQGLKILPGIDLVILDFEFGKNYAEAVALLKNKNVRVAIATTRILKPQEYYNLNTIIRCEPDAILVRNLGALEYLKNKCSIPLLGDFSLNVTNSESFEYLTSKGLQSVNLSYDLNHSQLTALIRSSDAAKAEVTVHQYMPEFHMEHCVFAAFLSTGSSFKDCGKPCERHEVKLKDPYGNMHFLKADHECRNTFFKATPQSAGFLIKELQGLGVGAVRVEALNESIDDLNLKTSTYLDLIFDRIIPDEASKRLEVIESYGLETGQILKTDSYKDRKKNAPFT